MKKLPEYLEMSFGMIAGMNPQAKILSDLFRENCVVWEGTPENHGHRRNLPNGFPASFLAMKACYYNSWEIATMCPSEGFQYFAGWAEMPGVGFGFEHAWLVRDGLIYDFTMGDVLFPERADRPAWYCGVEAKDVVGTIGPWLGRSAKTIAMHVIEEEYTGK